MLAVWVLAVTKHNLTSLSLPSRGPKFSLARQTRSARRDNPPCLETWSISNSRKAADYVRTQPTSGFSVSQLFFSLTIIYRYALSERHEIATWTSSRSEQFQDSPTETADLLPAHAARFLQTDSHVVAQLLPLVTVPLDRHQVLL